MKEKSKSLLCALIIVASGIAGLATHPCEILDWARVNPDRPENMESSTAVRRKTPCA